MAVALAVPAMTTGCGGPGGGTDPTSVVKKAQSLAQETLDAVRPTAGSAATSVEGGGWEKCPAGEPGPDRFSYSYGLRLDVPKDASRPVLDAAKAHFVEAGYTLDAPDSTVARVGGTLPRSHWWVGVGVQNESSMFISTGSGCLPMSSDPRSDGADR
ncbi:hypothetical protein ACL07V_13775 [Streptomyces sp. MB22_4]|uniref:hypothetical protein n=1 Tax=Streptomyces sp. MB22_4 TaxID=3383120 RepID=UPI0039A2F92C